LPCGDYTASGEDDADIAKKPTNKNQYAQNDKNDFDDLPGNLKNTPQDKDNCQRAQRDNEQVVELPQKFQIKE
jgi:hypothetical protein